MGVGIGAAVGAVGLRVGKGVGDALGGAVGPAVGLSVGLNERAVPTAAVDSNSRSLAVTVIGACAMLLAMA